MSLVTQAVTAAVALTAAASAASLWRGASRHAGPARHGYWLLAVAALLAGLGAVGQQALANATAGAALPLTPADLPGLLALPTLVAGVVSLRARREAHRHPLAQRRGRAGTALAYCADGYVLACALFIICWITMFSAAYAHSGDDPATFAGQLIRPLADLLVLGGILPLAVAAGRRGAAALAALLLITLSDALAVAARVSNGHPGLAAQLLLIAGLGLLGAAPWLDSTDAGHPDAGQFPAAGRHASTAIATMAAALAALVVAGAALAGGLVAHPVLAVAGGTLILALAGRIILLVHRDSVRARLWQESGQQFRELADRTSDVVLVCGYSGQISYASPAVRDYGYAPDSLEGRVLTDLVHPEDQPDGLRAVREAAGQPAAQIRYSCRVRAADGTWRYVEATISRHRSQGTPDRLLVTARDVSDLVALRRQIAQLTYHDGLTGLPNRAYLEDRAREALSLGQPGTAQASGAEPGLAGVILVDVDGFTGVNDIAGPSAGDLVLAQVARRLRAVVPPQGTVARWGGDEFAVLITGAASAQDITELGGRILASVAAEPYRAADRAVPLTASVGVALADGSPAGYVWRNADAAVSKAKEAGGGRLEVFAALPQADVRRRLQLASQLSRAVAGGELELEYLPLADLATSRIVGVTALPRWRLDGADVPHAEFLDIAETSGVIVELGDWMLRESCARVAGWWRSGWEASVWLRCSPRQIRAPRFPESVLEAASASGLAPHALILEAGQPGLAEDGDTAAHRLGELRERGVRLAMDASSADIATLARLSQHRVDLIRVGPGLVAGLGTRAAAETLIRAIARVGRDLGIEVVADGIERAEQRDLLIAIGCTTGMGAFLGGPLPAGSVPSLAMGSGRTGREPPFGGAISPAETNVLSS
ncbi:MAG TPA: EAL domain-containing protein [Streptosporangiaceae bacterium]|nr:EAL domain-containing protein [Streptosporangiaceae bacterium]